MGFTDKEFGCIDDGRIAGSPERLESPDDRAGERFVDCASFICVITFRPVVEILLDQQYLRSRALKFDQPVGTELAAIKSEVIRADTSGK